MHTMRSVVQDSNRIIRLEKRTKRSNTQGLAEFFLRLGQVHLDHCTTRDLLLKLKINPFSMLLRRGVILPRQVGQRLIDPGKSTMFMLAFKQSRSPGKPDSDPKRNPCSERPRRLGIPPPVWVASESQQFANGTKEKWLTVRNHRDLCG